MIKCYGLLYKDRVEFVSPLLSLTQQAKTIYVSVSFFFFNYEIASKHPCGDMYAASQ